MQARHLARDDLAAAVQLTEGREGPVAGSTRKVFDPAMGDMLDTAIVERTTMKTGDRISGPVIIVERETSTVVTSPFDAVMQGDGSILLIRKE